MRGPAKRRVLVVEHDPAWLEPIRRALTSSFPVEPEVVTCSDPNKAARLWASQPFDLIVSDFFFTDTTTILEFAESLAETNIPLIVLSGHLNVQRAQDLVNSLGVYGLVEKREVDLPALQQLVTRWLESTTAAKPFFSWLHVSDIHVGHAAHSDRFDQAAVCDALIRDARKAPSVDAVLVTGDITYQAKRSEYAQAADFFRKLSDAAEVDLARFFVVPGNHDVDRGVADANGMDAVQEVVRNAPAKLDDYLADGTRTELRKKLESYEAFVQAHLPNHPRGNVDLLDWVQLLDRGAGEPRLRLVGLSTVWVSNGCDGRRAHDDKTFVPNMAISKGQLDAALRNAEDDEIVLVLSHHPPEWMLDECRTEFERYLERRRHIHLCGHVHEKAAGGRRQLGRPGAPLRFVAGATHEAHRSGYRSEYGYAWGGIRENRGRWEVGWAPRVYVPRRDEMRADRTGYDLDAGGFAWEPVPWRDGR